MKKKLLTVASAMVLLCGNLFSQRSKALVSAPIDDPNSFQVKERCSTPTPPPEWDAWFNQRVEEFKANLQNQKMNNPTGVQAVTNYTIPVVVHVIHGGQAVGTYPNISAGQINSQITVLNQDYGGTGYNSNKYPATAFQGYASATANAIAAASKDASGRIAIANTGISFCMAMKDKNGNTMSEPGIDRVDWHTISGATDPALATTPTALRNVVDGVIKPATIWDPTKYMNIWITDEKTSSPKPGLLGYATFPAGTTLSGVSSLGTNTTDGFWAWTKVFGSSLVFPGGTYDATYKYGRTSTHEIGHWLGLRHIWGDGGAQCAADDYCNDTPPQKGGDGKANPPAGANYGCPTYPFQAGTCSFGGKVNTNGDMFMNFMDYSDDLCMYMFTMDQTTRIQTAMSTGTHRKLLGTHGLCNATPQPPIANFSFGSKICATLPATFTDMSSNLPNSWAWSVTPSTGVTITTATSQNPSITFTTSGTYNITLKATNAQGNNSVSKTVVVTNCANSCDTLRNITNLASIRNYPVDVAPYDSGFVGGNNAYKDIAKAEMYTDPGLNKKIKAIRVFIARRAGTGNVTFNVWDDAASVPGTIIGSQVVPISALANNTYYTVTFATPISPSAKFYVGFNIPTAAGDTVVCNTNSALIGGGTVGTGWELRKDKTWHSYSTTYSSAGTWAVSNYMFPIMCPSIGIDNLDNLLSNKIEMYPNPSNGSINFVPSFEQARDLTFIVTNTLGQQVYSKTEKNVSNNVINLDLTNKDKGIYVVTILDNFGEKAIKKVIIE